MLFKKLNLIPAFAIASVMSILATGCAEDDANEIMGVCPIVLSSVPMDEAVDVPLDQVISVTFNEEVNPETVNSDTFKVSGGSDLAGTVSYSEMTAYFTPSVDLLPNTIYTGTITTGVKDSLGNALQENYVWSFKTIPQIILSASPDTSGTVSGGGLFNNGSIVTVVATPNQGFEFINWTNGDNVVSTDATYEFEMNGNITLVANFEIATFELVVNAENGTVNKTPDQEIYNHGTEVTLTATPASGYEFSSWSEDATGNDNPLTITMDANKNITANFTQVNTVTHPQGIDLGSAEDFVVLSGSGIANTGVTTLLTGDVGSFPTATINGLDQSNVNGTLYTTASPIVEQAKKDLTSAYNDGQSRSLDAISLPGQLGGLTLAPGLYVNSTSTGISGTGPQGILTLNGDANAVWIFKMGSTLITDPGTSIVLAGGAQAKNIYWVVGTSATLGTNSIFFGNVIADISITLNTGASLDGRALTRSGSVSLDSNKATKP